ncbi:hypothetical protein BDV95DRAFT_669159 [Massariosphaeria phaeospora]|uniref:Uncharacterized protein n=1 Tax=Massariosphaeria phaeospora TaxID=100035 RepID=A0A7C8I3W5_9PLEO|nr:hypothetical protein BDV95DRAFT_669159 [Massariosphaeria phaeospora]
MAPTGATSSPAPAATASPPSAPIAPPRFAGEEFSSNLFADLAPLLTLFGEQVTKQFLSMSLGWADNILLGVGPLGIITAVVSAIRVGGGRRLKALIGRHVAPKSVKHDYLSNPYSAGEALAAAEQELLSSTSDEVCELWNGHTIVRRPGKAQAKEFVVFRIDYQTMIETSGYHAKDMGAEYMRPYTKLDVRGSVRDALSDFQLVITRDPKVSIRCYLQDLFSSDDPLRHVTDKFHRAIQLSLDTFNNAYSGVDLYTYTISWSHLVYGNGDRAFGDAPFQDLTRIYLSYSPMQGALLHDVKEWQFRKELNAILSLWHFTYKRYELPRLYTTNSVEDRIAGSDLKQNGFIRILGNCASFSPEVLRVLPKLIDQSIFLCPKPDGKSCIKDFTHQLASKEPPRWPVFGMKSITDSCSTHDLDAERSEAASDSSINQQPKGFQDLLSGGNPTEHRFENGGANDWEPSDEAYLAVVTSGWLLDQCLLDLYSGFLEAVAEIFASLESNPEVREQEAQLTGSKKRLLMQDFAKVLLETGLVDSEQDAKAIVIPPFLRKACFAEIGQQE